MKTIGAPPQGKKVVIPEPIDKAGQLPVKANKDLPKRKGGKRGQGF